MRRPRRLHRIRLRLLPRRAPRAPGPPQLLRDIRQDLIPRLGADLRERARGPLVPGVADTTRPPRLLLHALEFLQELPPLDAAFFAGLEPIRALEGGGG